MTLDPLKLRYFLYCLIGCHIFLCLCIIVDYSKTAYVEPNNAMKHGIYK